MAANTNGGKPRHDEDNISIIELDSVTVSTKQDILTEEKNQSIILQKYYFKHYFWCNSALYMYIIFKWGISSKYSYAGNVLWLNGELDPLGMWWIC